MSSKVSSSVTLLGPSGELNIDHMWLVLYISNATIEHFDINGSCALCHQMICPRSCQNYRFAHRELMTKTNIVNAWHVYS